MPCYHPIPATMEYDPRTKKRRMKLRPLRSQTTTWLRCGKCLGCRELEQQHMTIRIKHTARRWEEDEKHFLTLTYDEENLPKNGGLQVEHMKTFYKLLRYYYPTEIKYLTCGEYGPVTNRPHYHAAVMGLKINDLKKWDYKSNKSETIDKIWGKGIVTIGPLTIERIKYVAGYVLKKAGYQKQTYCTEDGEVLEAPFRTMSKGLGKEWIEKYKTDLKGGYLWDDGARYPIPRYYMDKLKQDEELLEYIQKQKEKTWKELTEEDQRRLNDGEKIRMTQIKEMKRDRL